MAAVSTAGLRPPHRAQAQELGWEIQRWCVGETHTAIRFVSMSFALARPWCNLDARQRCGCTHYTARVNTYMVRISYFSCRLHVHMCRHIQRLGARGDQRTVA